MKQLVCNCRLSAAILLAFLLVASTAVAQDAEIGESLGVVDFEITCDPAVKDDFNRAVALFHHMTYPFAFSAFESVTKEDPACSLGYWGMAMTLFQPLWPTRPGTDELLLGRELAQKGIAAGPASTREKMFLGTAEAFFDSTGAPDYWTRIDRWAVATANLYEAFPEDRDAKAFYALARLATAQRAGAAADNHAEAAGLLAEILADEPAHPGAVHYTIHANDFDGRQDQSLDVVRSYGDIAPRIPHALHMPTHIFVRLGKWEEVISWNERAAEAALAQRVGPKQEFVWDEYPHAVEYLIYAHLQRGDDTAAQSLIERMNGMSDLQRSFKTAFHLASTAARYALERRDWQSAASLQPGEPAWIDWDRFRWPEAVSWFARGLGAVHGGDADAASKSVARLESLERQAVESGEAYFATQIRILLLELSAWQAFSGHQPKAAEALMLKAVDLEEGTPKHPVTPSPAIPARELLGDLYSALGDPGQAHAAFRASNERTPGRLNTLLGLARTSMALGQETAAGRYYDEVLETTSPSSTRPGVIEARTFRTADK